MENQISGAAMRAGGGYALVGVVLVFIAGLFFANAGGSDREAFLALGFLFAAAGLLSIVVGGVAIGIQVARR